MVMRENSLFCMQWFGVLALSFIKDDEEPKDKAYAVDGAYIPRIYFVGMLNTCDE